MNELSKEISINAPEAPYKENSFINTMYKTVDNKKVTKELIKI